MVKKRDSSVPGEKMGNYIITTKPKMDGYSVLNEPIYAMSSKMKMYSIKKNSIAIVIALFAIALSSCKDTKQRTSRVEILPYYKDASFTPHWILPGSNEEKSFHTIPPFSLTNQEGRITSDKTLENKIYVADFFFTTCPGICPKMTANMASLQEAFLTDNDVMLISFSVTPDRDSVEVLKEYATNKGVNSQKWHLLTGDRNTIYTLGRKAYFVEENLGVEKDIDEFLHTENFVLIDKNKHIRGIYNGLNKTSVDQLIVDIKTLKAEH